MKVKNLLKVAYSKQPIGLCCYAKKKGQKKARIRELGKIASLDSKTGKKLVKKYGDCKVLHITTVDTKHYNAKRYTPLCIVIKT